MERIKLLISCWLICQSFPRDNQGHKDLLLVPPNIYVEKKGFEGIILSSLISLGRSLSKGSYNTFYDSEIYCVPAWSHEMKFKARY